MERAFEVSEPAETSSPSSSKDQFQPKIKATTIQPVAKSVSRKAQNTDHQSKKNFVEALQRSDNEFEIVVNDDGIVDTLSGNLQLRSSPDSSDSETTNATPPGPRSRYEIPDDHLMSRKATKILGDRKEVEMHEFRRKHSSSSSSGELSGDALRRRSHSRDFLSVPDVDPSGERDSPINGN